jgi:hypothetical protein
MEWDTSPEPFSSIVLSLMGDLAVPLKLPRALFRRRLPKPAPKPRAAA